MRTQIDFYLRANHVRTVNTSYVIPNLQVGQYITFDHPIMNKSLLGKIAKITHVVFLGDEPPLTYVDVQLDETV